MQSVMRSGKQANKDVPLKLKLTDADGRRSKVMNVPYINTGDDKKVTKTSRIVKY